MYPLLELHEHGKTNGWLQFVVKRLQIHASSIHFCLKIKCMSSKNLPSNINSSHIGKPRSWWKTTLHYQLHPGAHGKIHRTPEGETNPRSKCWEIMRYTVYHLLEIRYIRAVAGRLAAGNKLLDGPAYRGIKTPKHDNSRILWPKYISVITYNLYTPPKNNASGFFMTLTSTCHQSFCLFSSHQLDHPGTLQRACARHQDESFVPGLVPWEMTIHNATCHCFDIPGSSKCVCECVFFCPSHQKKQQKKEHNKKCILNHLVWMHPTQHHPTN